MFSSFSLNLHVFITDNKVLSVPVEEIATYFSRCMLVWWQNIAGAIFPCSESLYTQKHVTVTLHENIIFAQLAAHLLEHLHPLKLVIDSTVLKNII